MKPSPITKGLFVGGVGMLLVSVLFSINSWPAAELFSILGTIVSFGLYFVFQKAAVVQRKSAYARHATLVLVASAICTKSFGIAISRFLFLFGFIAFLIWFVLSVLEEIPTTEE
jgi:hypothetical protein